MAQASMDPPVSKLRMDEQTDQNASLREVMTTYPTGVTIVAAVGGDGEPFGLTVNSFTSLSLEPVSYTHLTLPTICSV